MYMPKPWTLTQDVMQSEYAIFEQTGDEQAGKLTICVGLVALLHEQLLRLDGQGLPEVYPVTSDERAQRWYILAYASNAFLYSTSILDLALRGHYLEAEVLVRCLLENGAALEYISMQQEDSLSIFSSRKGVPELKKVLSFLDVHGEFPRGGPRKMIRRFHGSAHASILERMRTWVVWDDNERIVGFRVHQYDSQSFLKISHHLVMPLLAAQQILYMAFTNRMGSDMELMAKWELARPFDTIREEFPDLWIHTDAR